MKEDHAHLSVSSYSELVWMDLVIETGALKEERRGTPFLRASHRILNHPVLDLHSHPHPLLQPQLLRHQILVQHGLAGQ
jgi:hypothetical protein